LYLTINNYLQLIHNLLSRVLALAIHVEAFRHLPQALEQQYTVRDKFLLLQHLRKIVIKFLRQQMVVLGSLRPVLAVFGTRSITLAPYRPVKVAVAMLFQERCPDEHVGHFDVLCDFVRVCLSRAHGAQLSLSGNGATGRGGGVERPNRVEDISQVRLSCSDLARNVLIAVIEDGFGAEALD